MQQKGYNMNSTVKSLYKEFPSFRKSRDNELEDSVSAVYGDFGLYVLDLLNISRSENSVFYFLERHEWKMDSEEAKTVLIKAFLYINELSNDSSYDLARFCFLEILSDYDEINLLMEEYLNESNKQLFQSIL